jgi:hypothetical protein
MDATQHRHLGPDPELGPYDWSNPNTFTSSLHLTDGYSWLSDAIQADGSLSSCQHDLPDLSIHDGLLREQSNACILDCVGVCSCHGFSNAIPTEDELPGEGALSYVQLEPMDLDEPRKSIVSRTGTTMAPPVTRKPRSTRRPRSSPRSAVTKSKRTKISDLAKLVLEKYFLKNPYPDEAEVSALQTTTNLKGRVIQT